MLLKWERVTVICWASFFVAFFAQVFVAISVAQMPDDALCLSVSMGGSRGGHRGMPPNSFLVTFHCGKQPKSYKVINKSKQVSHLFFPLKILTKCINPYGRVQQGRMGSGTFKLNWKVVDLLPCVSYTHLCRVHLPESHLPKPPNASILKHY